MGINLILDKAASGKEIATAVRQAAAERTTPAPTNPSARQLGYPLTLREGQVLEMLAEGKHNHEAAAELRVSSKTVEFHITNLMAKLGARSRMDAVFIAQDLGLIELGRVPPAAVRVTAVPTRRGAGPRAGAKGS
jgi:DNA-binding NarL/FixJ family response regulator